MYRSLIRKVTVDLFRLEYRFDSPDKRPAAWISQTDNHQPVMSSRRVPTDI